MQYQVPQFIEVEDKIIGPFTLKQFVYIAGGGGISFILWRTLPNFIAILAILPILGFSLALAFYKINKKPFIYIVEAAVRYFVGTKLYLWSSKRKKNTKITQRELGKVEEVYVPSLSSNKIKELAWNLDIQERVDKAEGLSSIQRQRSDLVI